MQYPGGDDAHSPPRPYGGAGGAPATPYGQPPVLTRTPPWPIQRIDLRAPASPVLNLRLEFEPSDWCGFVEPPPLAALPPPPPTDLADDACGN